MTDRMAELEARVAELERFIREDIGRLHDGLDANTEAVAALVDAFGERFGIMQEALQ